MALNDYRWKRKNTVKVEFSKANYQRLRRLAKAQNKPLEKWIAETMISHIDSQRGENESK